jgi:hypothetical protein
VDLDSRELSVVDRSTEMNAALWSAVRIAALECGENRRFGVRRESPLWIFLSLTANK